MTSEQTQMVVFRDKSSTAGNKGYTTMRGAVLRMTVLCKV